MSEPTHIVHLPAKVAGYCGICGADGNHEHKDYDLDELICVECVLPLVNAECALTGIAHCAQPTLKPL
jgi:hypothetical protein